nr:aldolase catalytic domain-containing protein [uncultured Flavobacterium sp.]
MENTFKILDCTLRDGGYYTNWDFDKDLVETYLTAMNNLPVEYLEVGYRSPKLSGYYGEYFYCPDFVLKKLAHLSNKKLVIILDEKNIELQTVEELLKPCIGIITMVRIAIDPEQLLRAIDLAKKVKSMGFEVGFNVMYMSKWKNLPEFLSNLKHVDGVADYFYMVDSYGGVYPEDVKEIFSVVRSQMKTKIGFHGHNNLELALINTLTAIECGADMVDTTITGMGRGAGNLKTELLLTALNQRKNIEIDFNSLSSVTDSFSQLQKEYEWGTNLPYMVSGANSLPQKDVMDWVGKRYYSYNSIIRALHNQSRGIKDNEDLTIFNLENYKSQKALIVGGGMSVIAHKKAIQKYLLDNPETVIIHASSKNAMIFKDLDNKQFFCLVGNEGHRMEDVFSNEMPKNTVCVLPTFPRKMGTYIPHKLNDVAFQLKDINFTDKFIDSHSAIALQISIELGVTSLEIVGYDGYSNIISGNKEKELFVENEYLFNEYLTSTKININSLTPTSYSNLFQSSIYTTFYGV